LRSPPIHATALAKWVSAMIYRGVVVPNMDLADCLQHCQESRPSRHPDHEILFFVAELANELLENGDRGKDVAEGQPIGE
jgi:hypothetical protein